MTPYRFFAVFVILVSWFLAETDPVGNGLCAIAAAILACSGRWSDE